MKGVYTASYRAAGWTGALTALIMTAPATKVIEILAGSITNESNLTNAQFYGLFQRVTTDGSGAGNAVTPVPTESGDQAAGTTVKNPTVDPTTFTNNTESGREGASTLSGWFYDPIPEERVYIAPSGILALRTPGAIASFNAVFSIRFREIG